MLKKIFLIVFLFAGIIKSQDTTSVVFVNLPEATTVQPSWITPVESPSLAYKLTLGNLYAFIMKDSVTSTFGSAATSIIDSVFANDSTIQATLALKASVSQVVGLSDSVSTAYANITLEAGNRYSGDSTLSASISLKVGEGDVYSIINIWKDTVNIQSENIIFTGNTTVVPGYTFTGAIIQTATSPNQRIVLNSSGSSNDIKFYGDATHYSSMIGTYADLLNNIIITSDVVNMSGSLIVQGDIQGYVGLYIGGAPYKFGVNSSGNITKINNVTTSFPASQGGANTYLRNDGAGNLSWVSGTVIYPGAGIALSTGSAWGTSITDNSANWNTAYGWGNHASAGYITSSYAHFTNTSNPHSVTYSQVGAAAAFSGVSGSYGIYSGNVATITITNGVITGLTEQ